MFKIFLLTFSFSFLLIGSSFSQKLKLRLEIGNSINFTSYKPTLFQNYFQGPISTSEYTYKKLPGGGLFGNEFDNWIPERYGIYLEYNYKKRNHIALGFMFRDAISVKDRVIFNYGYYSYGGKNNVVLPLYSEVETESALGKLSLEYSLDFGSGLFRVSPLLGVSYAWEYGVSPYDTTGISYDYYDNDLLYNNSEFLIERVSVNTGHTSTLMASAGFYIRVHSKKRELFAIKLLYEQGFSAMEMNQVIVNRNNKSFWYNVSYSYGSAFYLKLSIPIKLYTFNK